jgi:hypothetical protein
MNSTFANTLEDKFKNIDNNIQDKGEIQMLSNLKISDPLPDVVQPKAVLCKVIVLLNKTESGEVFYTVKLSKKMPDVDVPNVVIPQTQYCLCETELDDMYDD